MREKKIHLLDEPESLSRGRGFDTVVSARVGKEYSDTYEEDRRLVQTKVAEGKAELL